jgi:hypothetical protein
MTRSGTPTGDATRAQLEALLRKAGAAGTKLGPLARAVGLRDTSTWFHLLRMPCAMCAKTALKYRVRWFHADFADACRAYVAEQDGTAIHRFGCRAELVEAGMALIEQAGARGTGHAELVEALDVGEWTASNITRRLRDQCRVEVRRTVAANGYTALRFYTPDAAPPERSANDPTAQRLRQRKAKTAADQGLRVAGSTDRRNVQEKPTQCHELTPPAASINSRDHGLTLHPKARVTVDQRGNVNRWDTDRPQFPPPDVPAPGFAQMRPGQYLAADTAIARRYDRQGNP